MRKAKTLGLTVPFSLLARADAVIEWLICCTALSPVVALSIGTRTRQLSGPFRKTYARRDPYPTSIAKIVCKAGYHGARSIRLGYNDQDINRFRLKCQGVVMPVPFALVKHWINHAKTHDKWLILVFHQIEPTMTYLVKQRAICGATVSTLRRIVEYLGKQDIEVVTV
jgi:hypothetical protein